MLQVALFTGGNLRVQAADCSGTFTCEHSCTICEYDPCPPFGTCSCSRGSPNCVCQPGTCYQDQDCRATFSRCCGPTDPNCENPNCCDSICSWTLGIGWNYSSGSCNYHYCGDGACEASAEVTDCRNTSSFCSQDCGYDGLPTGAACIDADGCPGIVTCPSGGGNTICVKNDKNCPCNYTVDGLSNDPLEVCDINIGSCGAGCNPKQDYDEDTCSESCGYSQYPYCGYTPATPRWETDLGQQIYNSGEMVVATAINADPKTKLFKYGLGHNGDIPSVITGTVTSSYNNHVSSGPSLQVESPSHEGVCSTPAVIVDHFPTVESIRVLDYTDNLNRVNINQTGRLFSSAGWSGKENGDKDTSNPNGGSNLPNELLIPEDQSDRNNTSDRNNMYECDDKNPVIFQIEVRDDDDVRELDQVNVGIGPDTGDRLGGCGSFESNLSSNFIGLTFEKNGVGNSWTVSDLCGVANSQGNYELVGLGGGGNQQFLVSNGGGNVLRIRFAIKFGNLDTNNVYKAFMNDQHLIWVKARDEFSVWGQTHHMYSGWPHPRTGPNGNRYMNNNVWWGVDTEAPKGTIDGSMSYDKVTAEIIDVNWHASDRTVVGDDRSGLRSMMFGCYQSTDGTNMNFGDDSVVGYPFNDSYRNSAGSDVSTLASQYRDGYTDAELADMARVLGACQIARRKPQDSYLGTPDSGTNFTDVIDKFHPFIEVPTDQVGDVTYYDSYSNTNGYEASNPFPYVITGTLGSQWGVNGLYSTNFRKTTWQDFHPVFNEFITNPTQSYTHTARIGGLEENTTYRFREIVTDEACNVGVSDLNVEVKGKWAQTIGGEVFADQGIDNGSFSMNGDLTNWYKQSPFNPVTNGTGTDVAFSTFGITTGPSADHFDNTSFGNKWYTDPDNVSENVQQYNVLDPTDNSDTLLDEEIFGENKLFDRLYNSVPNDKVFIADQTGPASLRPCNALPSRDCDVNEWEKDLREFIHNKGDGVYRIAVKGSNNIYFQGNETKIDKNVILLFYHSDGAGNINTSDPNVEVNFWAHLEDPAIYLVRGSVVYRSTGQDWVRESELNSELEASGELGTKWPCSGGNVGNTHGCDIKGSGAQMVNRDDHIYYDPTDPALDGFLDPGVDIFNSFMIASERVTFEKELAVGGDPAGLGNDLNIYDVSDRNFERAELFGSIISKDIKLNRDLIALDNQYIPAEKIVYNPRFMDIYVKATTGVFGVVDAQQWNENGLY